MFFLRQMADKMSCMRDRVEIVLLKDLYMCLITNSIYINFFKQPNNY